MKRLLLLIPVIAALGCGTEAAYRPAPQILPASVKRIAVRLIINKTQQFGLEDRFTRAIIDEFLRDGRYPILPETHADGVVQVTITRYLLTPVQYDTNLVPTAYKLRVLIDLQFIDRAANTALWSEKNIEGVQLYPAATLPGGMTEETARENIWNTLSRDVVKRVIEGFGSVTGTSQRLVSPEGPSTQPPHQPPSPQKPVNPNPY